MRSLPLHHLAGAVRVARNNPGGASRLARGVHALTPGVLRSDPVRRTFRRFVYGRARRGPRSRLHAPSCRCALHTPEAEALSALALGRDLVTRWGYGQSRRGGQPPSTRAPAGATPASSSASRPP